MMIRSQIALIQRELWEHRAIYVTPIVIGLVISLMAVTGQVSVNSSEHADIAILGISNLGEHARAAAITMMMTAVFTLIALAMSVVAIFYSLDSLYAERKDKSILFWRSIPVTDFETVFSKLLTVLLVVPLITFAAVVLTQLMVGIVMSVWVGIKGASAWHLIWQSAPLLDVWTVTLVILIFAPLWLSPFVGWFLLVSAYTKRTPVLLAFLPIVVLPMLEKSLIGTEMFKDAIFVRSVQIPLFKSEDMIEHMFKGDDFQSFVESGVSLVSILDLGRFFSSPGFWAGLVVCGLFTTAAIYVRRYRDDS